MAEPLEVVPEYSLKLSDSPNRPLRLLLEVLLPGVQSAKDIVVLVQDTSVSVSVPGRYILEVPLGIRVTQKPEAVKYIRTRSLLRSILVATEGDSQGGTHCGNDSSPIQGHCRGPHVAATNSTSGFVSDTAREKTFQHPAQQHVQKGSAANAAAAEAMQPAAGTTSAAQCMDFPEQVGAAGTVRSQHSPSASKPPPGAANGVHGRNHKAAQPHQRPHRGMKRGFLSTQKQGVPGAARSGGSSQNSLSSGPSPVPRDATQLEAAAAEDARVSCDGNLNCALPATGTGESARGRCSDEEGMHEAAKVRHSEEAAAAFSSKASLLLDRATSIAEVERAIGLLHKASRLEPGTCQEQLRQAEKVAERVRSRSPAPEAAATPDTSSSAGAGAQWRAAPPDGAHSPPDPGGPPRSGEEPPPDEGRGAHGGQHGAGSEQEDRAEASSRRWWAWWDVTSEEYDAMDKWQRRLLIAFMTLCLICKTVLAVVPVVAKTALHYSILLAKKTGSAALYMQTATALSIGCFIFNRRVYQHCEDTLKGGGKAAAVFHACTSAVMAACAFLSPGLVTWPFHVAAFSWCHLLWRPHRAVSLAQLLLLWLCAEKAEPVMWLLVGWPPMVWAVGGRWWGLGGILSHVAAIVLFGNRVTSTTATFLIHALWIVISWLFLLSWYWSWSLVACIIYGAFTLITNIPGEGSGQAGGAAAPNPQPDVPAGATGEVARVLGSCSHYQVLEVPHDADETTILKAKRTKLLACHPDKVGIDAVGAGHAVGRITAALHVLTSPTERKRYDAQLLADERAEQPTHERSSGSAQCSTPSEDAIYFPSSRAGEGVVCCPRVHQIKSSRARRCDTCSCFHPVKHDDIWVEKTPGFFGTRTMLFCQNSAIFDVSKWADVEGAWASFHPNHHEVINVGRASRPSGPRTTTGAASKGSRKKKGRRGK